jgi:hypothetical protein
VLSDFNAPASQNNVGQISGVMEAGGWYSTGLQEEAFGFVNKTGMTQFRLRFFRDDDDDMRADVIRFFSGNAAAAYRPVLIVYYLP